MLGISLQRDGGESFIRQLYTQLRALILSGQLSPGQRLPSTRILADEIGISRHTTTAAYEQLQAEGYIVSAVGSGSRVSEYLPEGMLNAYAAPPIAAMGGEIATSRRSRDVEALGGDGGTWLPAFSPGMPAIDRFPFAAWSKLLAEEWRRPGLGALPHDPGGHWPFRENIANYVRSARGVICDADQVIVVSGNREGTELAARVLLDPGEAAIVEDPGYPGTRSSLAAAGITAVPLRVDDDGLVTSELGERHAAARMLCTAPSHHYPLGGTTSLARRLELLEWSRARSCWIVEDDYDSEFRYSERPLPSLQSLDRDSKVIYVGTFSKTLFPSLRIGYVIVPKRLIEPFVKMKVASTGPTSMLSQRAISRFMESDQYYRHIRAMRKLYAGRRAALIDKITRRLPELVIPAQQNAGLFLATFFGDTLRQASDVAVAHQARALGIHVEPLSGLYMAEAPVSGLVFGFGALDEEAMIQPLARLKNILGAASG